MIEVGDGAGLGQVELRRLRGISPVRMRDLDRDLAVQLVVVSETDEAETAFAQKPFDAVATDARSGLSVRKNSAAVDAGCAPERPAMRSKLHVASS